MARDPDYMEEATGGRRTTPAPPVEPTMINGIPRDALLLVLSRLEAREVVRMCVLSREWGDLWRDVPRINVLRQEFGADADGNYEEGNPQFNKFVNHLLMLRNPVALDKFGLWHYIGSQLQADSAYAKVWIAHALLSKARAVDVFVWGNALEIGPGVFTSQCLTNLQLNCCNFTAGFFGHLQSGCCKALRCLILQDCRIHDAEISSHSLEILAIGMDSVFTSDDRVSISIPSLLDLHMPSHAFGRRLLIENTESLRIANISVGWLVGWRALICSMMMLPDNFSGEFLVLQSYK